MVPPDTPSRMTFREWLDAAWRGRWILLASILLIAIPVSIWALRQPDQYRAYSVLLVQTKNNDLAAVLPATAGRVLLGQDRRLGNEMLILRQSLPLAERVAARLISLRRVPETREPITSILGRDGRTLDTRTVALRLQSGYLQVQSENRDVDAIRISVVSTSAGEAALIANLFAEEYLGRSKESSRAGYSASREFLEEQIGNQAQALEGEEAAMKAFMTREGAVNLDQETEQIVSQVSSLQAERDAAAIEAQMARSRANALQQELNSINSNLDRRVASGVDRELTEANQRLTESERSLETIYTARPSLRTADEVPAEVQRLRDRVEQAQTRVRELSRQQLRETMDAGGVNPSSEGSLERLNDLRRDLTQATIEANALEAKQGVLSQRIAQYEGRLRQVPSQAIELAQRQRARQSTEKLFLGLNEKLQEARVAEQSQLGYAEQVRAALRPSSPFAPARARTMLLGLLAALAVGFAGAVASVRMDRRIYIPHDLNKFSVPMLGLVPDMQSIVKRDFGGEETIRIDGQTYDTHLTTLLNPLSSASEAFRHVRASLLLSRPDAPMQVIVVTSSMPTEGKSTVASNLAIVLAQSGHSVVLIDGDLRKPSVHKKFGRSREIGVSNLLFQKAHLSDEAFRTQIDDLTIVSAGESVPNPAELLGSRSMMMLIEQARSEFDYVIIDTPPILLASDALLLAPQADGFVAVVRSGQSNDYEFEQALERMRRAKAPLLGVVLNGYDPRSRLAYGYQYQYAYYNDYNDGSKSPRRIRRRVALDSEADATV